MSDLHRIDPAGLDALHRARAAALRGKEPAGRRRLSAPTRKHVRSAERAADAPVTRQPRRV